MALYPTQYSEWKRLQDSGVDEDLKKSCGRPGLNGGYFDNPNLKFGVNCYGVKDSATDEEIENQALKWIFSRGNRTGRSAFQFFKYYCSSKNITI